MTFAVPSIVAEGLDAMRGHLEFLPNASKEAARIAINSVATGSGLKLLRKDMEEDVAFPAGYLDARVFVKRKAYNENLEAVLAGRTRPTSLARFVREGRLGGKGGVKVAVKPGTSKAMPNAFLMRLRAGKAAMQDQYNLGLAIRLKPGERILNKRTMISLDRNLYLLYGPSVDQVFQTSAADVAPEILELAGAEYLRQFQRLTEG